MSTVYILRMPARGICKIGITDNLPRRLKQIASGHTHRVYVHTSARLSDARQIERWLHARYARQRLPQAGSGGTEWFAVHPIRPALWLWVFWTAQALYRAVQIAAIGIAAIALYMLF